MSFRPYALGRNPFVFLVRFPGRGMAFSKIVHTHPTKTKKMKYTITIPEPCHENWHLMSPTEKGRFCASCQKEVLDFTQTSNYQLGKMLDNNEGLCGRFRHSQLNKPFSSHSHTSLTKTSLVFGISSLLALCTPLVAQESSEKIESIAITSRPLVLDTTPPLDTETVKGTVLDADNFPLPGASIVLEDSTIGTQTDFDGNFELQIPKNAFDSNKKLVVTYIGFERKEICLNQIGPKIRLELKLPMQEVFLGGVVVVKRRTIFNRIAHLFRKKHRFNTEEPEELSCDMAVEPSHDVTEEKDEDSLPPATVAIQEEMVPEQTTMVWPNPASNEMKLKYRMQVNGPLHIQLVPIYGLNHSGFTLVKGQRKKGEYEEVFQLNGIQNGLYALIITKNQRMEEFKVLIEKK